MHFETPVIPTLEHTLAPGSPFLFVLHMVALTTVPVLGLCDYTEAQELIASDADAGDEFGRSVSVDGDVIGIEFCDGLFPIPRVESRHHFVYNSGYSYPVSLGVSNCSRGAIAKENRR